MTRVILDLTHLEYILSKLPIKPETAIGEQARSIIEKSIASEIKVNESLEFEWFFHPDNEDLPLKNFIALPMKTKLLQVSEFFNSFNDPVYVRVINALQRRNCYYIHQLVDLTIFQFRCTRNMGDRSHLAILRSLQQANKPD